jgi:glycerol-3-phosphate dehydrogenase
MADYDLAIIGGGLNGLGIARDAAGRGLRVLLVEQGDFGQAASAAVLPILQADLHALEDGRLEAVRSALAERDHWLAAAPHLVQPLDVVVPLHGGARPPWLWRLGLSLQDRLGGIRPGGRLAPAAAHDLSHHEYGDPLQRPYRAALSYAAARADMPRLVQALALDAAARGAELLTGARCARADRGDVWTLAVIDRGRRRVLTARALVNASGAWTASVAETVLRQPAPPVRLIQTSLIVVPALFDHAAAYLLQSPDGRLVHVLGCEGLTMIGAVTHDFIGDPAIAAVSSLDSAWLRTIANRYFRTQLGPSDVVHAAAGVGVVDATVRRAHADGVIRLDKRFGEAPLLTVFGGATTTLRARAARALSALSPFFALWPDWTAAAVLPGGDLPGGDPDLLAEQATERWPFLPPAVLRRLVAAHGTAMAMVLAEAAGPDDLGPDFGEGLTGCEVRYLMRQEQARFPDDVLWRRSRLGLRLTASQRAALAAFMADGALPRAAEARATSPLGHHG